MFNDTIFMKHVVKAFGAMMLVLLPHMSTASTLTFTYTSNQYGVLGSFTMDEAALQSNIGNPYSGYVSNSFISGLNFSYGSLTWTTSDITTTDYTIFGLSGGVPQVVGGSGYLAHLSSIPGRSGGITIFAPNWGTEFGTAGSPIPGVWTTSIAPVPEPETYAMLLAGLGLLGVTLYRKGKPAFQPEIALNS